ncbi:MAG: CBS domain-containing protein [Rubrivivax sp.]|nr:CBS domain-containing protein [Rubrivivax sp.]
MSSSPSTSLLSNLEAELARHLPFAQMDGAHRRRFIAAARQAYFAPDEQVLSPDDGPVTQLFWIRQGAITGRKGLAELSQGAFQYEAGDLFPVGAMVGARPVTATYTASVDTFCLCVPAAEVQALAAESSALADFLQRRMLQFLDLSRRAAQSAYSARALAEVSLETPLARFARKSPLTCAPDTPLAQALGLMHERRVGSMLVVDDAQAPLGILTRYDILSRITLPQVPLTAPISQVMSAPVHSLGVERSAQDAALLMSQHGVRHVPVTEGGRAVSIVSERDLFAMQKLSLKQVSTAVRAAQDVESLAAAAADVRRFARHLLGQGVHARQTTELVSHLNDVLTEHLVTLLARQRGMDLQRACWLAFGSEGRGEQTIATDQDNGLIFDPGEADLETERARWLAFAREVNEALARCGYPLCKGGVMASNPACCLTADEWRGRFAHWIDHGAPQDLLNASIYFDLRGLVGRTEWVAPLATFVAERARAMPRFLKQLADNALRQRAPLNWLGAVEPSSSVNGRDMLDLKLNGTALFVDAARLFALAHGITALGTRPRFEAVGQALDVKPAESEAWVTGFEFLQMLRLSVQLDQEGQTAAENPNLIALDSLNEIDRRVLRETLRVARRLQQRMALDYQR